MLRLSLLPDAKLPLVLLNNLQGKHRDQGAIIFCVCQKSEQHTHCFSSLAVSHIYLTAIVAALQVFRNTVHCTVASVVDTVVLACLTARAVQALLYHEMGLELCVATLHINKHAKLRGVMSSNAESCTSCESLLFTMGRFRKRVLT